MATQCERLVDSRGVGLDQLALGLLDLQMHRGKPVQDALQEVLQMCYSPEEQSRVAQRLVVQNSHFIHYPGVYYVYPMAWLLSEEERQIEALAKIGMT